MKSRMILLTGVAVLCITALALAAAGINLSGTWVLDKDKSDTPGRGGFGGGPGGGPAGPGGGPGGRGPRGPVDVTLVIKQTDSELQIVRKTNREGQERETEQKFTLDGKENTNPAGMGRGELKSKTKIDKDKIVIEGSQKMQTKRGDFDLQIKEVYTLSSDGKVLTIQTTRDTPMGENTSKQVFNKK